MRALVVGLVVALGLPVVSHPAAHATSRRGSAKHPNQKSSKGPKAEAADHGHKDAKGSKGTKGLKGKTRSARLSAISVVREHEHIEPRELARGQSVGAPWAGRLQHATQLPPGDGYHIRRPTRSFGTEATVELIERAIGDTLEQFPDAHVLAIGDLSAESGGPISEHRSHQSGRDVDIGLLYHEQPAGYPGGFVHADADNLDCAATFKLIESFLASASEDGGAQMIFLDFEVQGILYAWAQDHGVSERRLERIFQYPHGRGSGEGLVRHEPNHDNHLHVRFQCPNDDPACR
jgi:penicillin-insensitive murein endopeptidase